MLHIPRGLAAVLAVALAASIAGIGNAFAYDDIHLIELNTRFHSLANWREILTSPYWPPPYNQEHYRPLTSLLFTAQYELGGGGPLAFRITSYALYAGCAAAFLSLAARLLPPGIALAVALLFAAHPVHVEAVAPAVGQSELLVALAALVMAVRYLDRRKGNGLTGRDWGLLGALYLAASLSKEHGLLIPALLLALEALLIRGGTVRQRASTLWRGYAFLGALTVGLVSLRVALLGGEFSRQWTAEVFDGLSMGGRALTMLGVVPEWARLMLWPAHLQADYAPQEIVAATSLGLKQAAGVLLLLSAGTAWWLARRRAPAISLGVLWMAVTLFPASNVLIPTGSVLAERLLFLPSAGFLLALGGLTALLIVEPKPSPSRKKGAWAVCLLLVLGGVGRSVERHRVWRNEAFFSVRGVQDAPLSYRMNRGYAEILFELDRWDLAMAAYDRALELAPPTHVWRVRNDLARRLRAEGRSDIEVDQLSLSLEQNPDQEDTRGYLIIAFLALGRYSDAAAQADSALARHGDNTVFRELRALADSAAGSDAPPGTVRVGIRTGPVSGLRPAP